MKKRCWLSLTVLALCITLSASVATAKKPSGEPSRPSPRMKMTTKIPESIVVPDTIETRIGTLEFFDGFPTEETTKKAYDYLDFQRAVDVFLDEMRAASMVAIRNGFQELGIHEANQVAIFESLMDSKALWLTANTETVYASTFMDLKANGPMVIESPPNILGILDDMWMRYVGDMGNAGPDKGKRLELIAEKTWQRHFDDRLGLSLAELQRVKNVSEKQLPATEHLLADKKEHIIRRPKDIPLSYDPEAMGISMNVPKHLYNQGELYNLSVARGTLTEEERYKINEHTIHTTIMLNSLPFPKGLERVSLIAGAHHETMTGSGYPRGLKMAELPVQARIMAIADIFEALTASDRPYKKAKTLNEALRILSFFRNDKHIDADLFDLFLLSGVYVDYADKFLEPDQIDEVDITKYLSDPALAADS